MSANHLLSASLYSELFQHNLVSPDGRIIANEQQLRDYSNFLKKQSKDKVTCLYAERVCNINHFMFLNKIIYEFYYFSEPTDEPKFKLTCIVTHSQYSTVKLAKTESGGKEKIPFRTGVRPKCYSFYNIEYSFRCILWNVFI